MTDSQPEQVRQPKALAESVNKRIPWKNTLYKVHSQSSYTCLGLMLSATVTTGTPVVVLLTGDTSVNRIMIQQEQMLQNFTVSTGGMSYHKTRLLV